MKASRKQTKTRAVAKAKKAKSKKTAKKAKPKKAIAKKAKVKKVAANAAPATAATTQDERDVGSLIKRLDVSSLRNEDLTSILQHCTATLDFRKAIDNADASFTEASANYCYTKSGDSSTVSIWSNRFKVGETSEANAKANGIPPCG